MNKPSLPAIILRGVALYALAYGCYWGAAWLVGSPHEFRNLWAKALILPGIAAAAFYFNKTDIPTKPTKRPETKKHEETQKWKTRR